MLTPFDRGRFSLSICSSSLLTVFFHADFSLRILSVLFVFEFDSFELLFLALLVVLPFVCNLNSLVIQVMRVCVCVGVRAHVCVCVCYEYFRLTMMSSWAA